MKSLFTRLSGIPQRFVWIAALLAGYADAYAQPLQGWTGTGVLDSVVVDQDGKKVEPFGSNPRGSPILGADGRFSVILLRAGLPNFALNSRTEGAAGGDQAVVQGRSGVAAVLCRVRRIRR